MHEVLRQNNFLTVHDDGQDVLAVGALAVVILKLGRQNWRHGSVIRKADTDHRAHLLRLHSLDHQLDDGRAVDVHKVLAPFLKQFFTYKKMCQKASCCWTHFEAVGSSHADVMEPLLDVFLGVVVLEPLLQPVHDELAEDAPGSDHFLRSLWHEETTDQFCN